MSENPIVSPRERELLDVLEQLRRTNTKITVEGFSVLVGYANKSALRHFPVLKRELSLYIAQFSPVRGKKSQPSAVRYLEVQIERLQRKCEHQTQELTKMPELEKQIATLQEELKHSHAIIRQLRAMISTLINFFSNNDLTRALDISNQLEKLARSTVEGNIQSGQ